MSAEEAADKKKKRIFHNEIEIIKKVKKICEFDIGDYSFIKSQESFVFDYGKFLETGGRNDEFTVFTNNYYTGYFQSHKSTIDTSARQKENITNTLMNSMAVDTYKKIIDGYYKDSNILTENSENVFKKIDWLSGQDNDLEAVKENIKQKYNEVVDKNIVEHEISIIYDTGDDNFNNPKNLINDLSVNEFNEDNYNIKSSMLEFRYLEKLVNKIKEESETKEFYKNNKLDQELKIIEGQINEQKVVINDIDEYINKLFSEIQLILDDNSKLLIKLNDIRLKHKKDIRKALNKLSTASSKDGGTSSKDAAADAAREFNEFINKLRNSLNTNGSNSINLLAHNFYDTGSSSDTVKQNAKVNKNMITRIPVFGARKEKEEKKEEEKNIETHFKSLKSLNDIKDAIYKVKGTLTTDE